MVFILLMLGVLSFYCLFKSYINKYSWYFCAIIWSLIAAMYASFLLISASGNYISVGYILGDIDGKMFLSIIANKLNLFTIVRIFNFSSAVFLCSLSLFSNSYFTDKAKVNALRTRIKKLLLFVFPALYCIFYDPEVVYFLYCHSVEGPGSPLYFTACFADLLFYVISAMYMLMPLVSLWKRKKQLFGISLFIALSNIIYIIILRLFSLRRLYFLQTPSELVSIRTYGAQFRNEYLIYPVIILIAIMILIITLGRFHLIRQDGVIRRFLFDIQAKRNQKIMTGILHSVKGTVYSYKLTVDDAVDIDPSSAQSFTLRELSHDMDAYITSLSETLNSKDIRGDFSPDECYLSDILDDALAEFHWDENINVETNYEKKKEMVYADSYYLENALLNILHNASDAISAKNTKGTIKISVSSEFDLAVISVSDTGTGIRKRDLKRIFSQFYTTKSRVKNWGIGLSFTYKIIKKHKGHISVKSQFGKGTVFDIILPKI